jgi:hypothetical protein
MVDVQGCIPAPLNYAPPGYAPYPKSICASVNHQVCHGVPNDRPLKKGDIVNLDITVGNFISMKIFKSLSDLFEKSPANTLLNNPVRALLFHILMQ